MHSLPLSLSRVSRRLAIALGLLGLAATALADSVTASATKDVMAKAKFPDTNFGADINLQTSAQGGFEKITYVQFTVSGIPVGATGVSAAVKLRSQTTTGGMPHAVTIHTVTSTTWIEAGVTWNAKPALNAGLTTVSNFTSGSDASWDVTSVVPGNGTYAFAFDSTFVGDTTFTSKEGGVAPTLVVTYTPAAPATVSFNVTDASASEAALDPGTIQVVSSTAAPAGGLVVKYTISGSAQANHDDNPAPDYILSPANSTATSGSITIPAGSTTATLTLTPIQDTLFEGKETAIFTLTPDAAYTVGAPRVAQVVIADNESAPTGNPDHASGQQGGWITPLSGTLPNSECSGMAASRQYPGVVWYHRDGTQNTGDPREKLYAIEVSNATNNGTVIKTIDITAPAGWTGTWKNQQWEDMAEDPDVPGVLWIGDIGNNAVPATRTDVILFKLNEPNPYGAATSQQVSTAYYLRYPGGLAFNAECLFIFEGIPHIIVKESGNPRIYRAPSTSLSTNSGSPTVMELVGTVHNGGGTHSVSAFSSDRKRMVLSTHVALWVFESQSALDPATSTLTPAQALTYIQDLLCTRNPAWSLKHNGGQPDPEAQNGSCEGGCFIGDSYDILLGAEGRQVTFYPRWWYETQPGAFATPPAAPTVNNSAPEVLLFKPSDGSPFSKSGAGSITFQAVASDVDGTVSNVKFYQQLSGGSRTLVGPGTLASGYYSLSWNISAAATGTYTLSADATDNSGAVTTDSVTVTINP
jgi:hypothetical protein